jgi:hypothetical protein
MSDLQLTQYDEYPVHQAAYPFSHIPSTDYSWDDGYYFGVFNPDTGVFLATGMRVNPNTDMVGGYALLNVNGRQFTTRFNRAWRREVSMRVGPYRIDVVEPMKTLRLVLEENASGLSFDVMWEGTSPAFLEQHHVATNRGRRTTDQTRYSQPGRCSGFIALGNQRWAVTPDSWGGARDHSWGLYAERPPLGPDTRLLPPRETPSARRALRFWSCFTTGKHSGFFHLHEDEDGNQPDLNDVFGNPFEGHIYRGWSADPVPLRKGRHTMTFFPGSRQLQRADFVLTDEQGRDWKLLFETPTPPWIVNTMGYHPGSWKDGGNFFTYHGSEELALEWDDFDFSKQPVMYTPYGADEQAIRADGFGLYANYREPIYGLEYNARVTTIAPDGSREMGCAQLEMFLTPPYKPAGLI